MTDGVDITAPLEELCHVVGCPKKPMDEMSDEELRDFVVYLQTMRTSHQSFKAEMEKPIRESQPTKVAPKSIKGMEEFF